MSPTDAVYDLIGLGFGPANVAIAGALVEKWDMQKTSSHPGHDHLPIQKVLFIEKYDKFRWHPGMLLPDARMQISFMKDLATLRSPQSPLTFLSYLHSQGRLVAFINRGSTVPTRKEYADYLAWAAQFVQDRGVAVNYGQEVIALSHGRDNTIEVRSRNVVTGEETALRARDIIISPGGSPKIPQVLSSISPHPSIIHSSTYATSIGPLLESLASASSARPLRVAVIGSGQSAAEVTMDLHNRLSRIPSGGGEIGHNVDMMIRKGSIKPSDDSPFANEIFDPSSTDTWFSMTSQRARETQLAEYKSTNYGVVNHRTLESLYEIIYDQKLEDGIARRTGDSAKVSHSRITIRPYSSILSINPVSAPGQAVTSDAQSTEKEATTQEAFTVIVQNTITRAISEQNYDAIICATGYQRSSWRSLLKSSNIGKYFGLYSASTAVQLTPDTERLPRRMEMDIDDSAFDGIRNISRSSEVPSPSIGSAFSTPPTSPEPSTFSSTHLDIHHCEKLYVSRNYRLLPVPSEVPDQTFKPRIYVQGVEEETHGLSDTLLSVIGVRAGEVVADLCDHIRG